MADWRKELGSILEKRARASRAEQENAQFEAFMRDVVAPALNDLAEELRKHDRTATVRTAPAAMVLSVSNGESEEISFRVLRRSVPNFVVAYAEIRIRKGQRLVRMDTNIKDDLKADSLDLYRRPHSPAVRCPSIRRLMYLHWALFNLRRNMSG